MALYDDSYEERQEDEVEFLQAVFPGDFEDLRNKDTWKVGGERGVAFPHLANITILAISLFRLSVHQKSV